MKERIQPRSLGLNPDIAVDVCSLAAAPVAAEVQEATVVRLHDRLQRLPRDPDRG